MAQVLASLRAYETDYFAKGIRPRGPLTVRCGAPRLHNNLSSEDLANVGTLRTAVEDLLEDLEVDFKGAGVGALKVTPETLERVVIRNEYRAERDEFIRASLVRHAVLPASVLLAVLVSPKLLPFAPDAFGLPWGPV